MKLCIVTTSFSGGGAEKVAVNLANHYSEEGFEVSLLAFKSVGPYKEHLSNKVKLVDLKGSKARYVLFKLRKAILNDRPSHLISVIRGANIMVGLAMPRRLPCTVAFREASTMHSVEKMSFFKNVVFKSLMKLAYRRADLVIANSQDTKDDLVKNFIIEENKARVIGNPVIPVDIELKANEEINNQWFHSDNEVVLNVGRLCPQKGQEFLINAFSKVVKKRPKAKLLILGEGDEKQALLNQIESLGIQDSVQLLAFRKNPFPYYRGSDVFVLTSDWEGFGNVLVEALACGTPVISTDCPGGPRTILDNGRYGTLVPRGDVDSLADAIVEQLSNPDRWNRKVLENRGKEYTVPRVAADYLFQITQAR